MAVLWVTAFMSSHLLYCSHRGGSLFAQLPGCIGHVTYEAVTAISDAITRPQTNREVGGGLVKGAPLTSAQEKVFRTHLWLKNKINIDAQRCTVASKTRFFKKTFVLYF
jgi:hypothetical protein